METLVVGLSDAVQNFSALPSVKEELKDIKKIMNANKMYMNQTFTIPNVQNEFKHNDYAIGKKRGRGKKGDVYDFMLLLART